jgi:hypothetical protein
MATRFLGRCLPGLGAVYLAFRSQQLITERLNALSDNWFAGSVSYPSRCLERTDAKNGSFCTGCQK